MYSDNVGILGQTPGLDPGTWLVTIGEPMPRAYLWPINPVRQPGAVFQSSPPGVHISGRPWGPNNGFQPWLGWHLAGLPPFRLPYQCWDENSPYASSYGQECGGGSFEWNGGWIGLAVAQPGLWGRGPLARYRAPRPRIEAGDRPVLSSILGQDLATGTPDLTDRPERFDGLTLMPYGTQFYIHPDGYPVLVWNGGTLRPPPGYVPEVVCAEGPLETWVVPGVSQTWPMVGGWAINPYPDFSLFDGWSSGKIPLGSIVRVCGLPSALRGHKSILPEALTVHELAAPPPPGTTPEFPEEWKPELAPPGEDADDDDILLDDLDENGLPLDDLDGTGPSDGFRETTGNGAPGADGVARAGFVGDNKIAMAVLGLLLLPIIFPGFGKDKK